MSIDDSTPLNQQLEKLVLAADPQNVMEHIAMLRARNLNSEEMDALIGVIEPLCLSRLDLLTQAQLHLRGDCIPIATRFPLHTRTTLGSVCNKKLTFSTEMERMAALQDLMIKVAKRYCIACNLKASRPTGSSFITLGLSENFDERWCRPKADEIFYGETGDVGQSFTILDYIDIPNDHLPLFTLFPEDDFMRDVAHVTLRSRQSYLFALMLTSVILNDENIIREIKKFDDEKLLQERKALARIERQQELSCTSLTTILAETPEIISGKTNTVLSYLVGRFDQYDLEGYTLIWTSENSYRFIFPHGIAILNGSFQATSVGIVPEERLEEGRDTADCIEDPDTANKIVAPILDKFVQLVITSSDL